MKKAISLLLSLAICLCLPACGSNNPPEEPQPYAHILEMLENGDYEGVHAAIDILANENGASAPPVEATMPAPTTPESEPEESESVQTVFYIHDAAELFSIGDDAENTYILANDIDLHGQAGTIPSFHGILDGNGMAILNAAAPLINANSGTVMNLRVQNCSIQLTENAAAIAITNSGSIINCTVSGIVTSTAQDAFAGGIVCTNNATIENCTNNASVTAESYALNELGNVIHGTWANAGGICARNSGNITRCANTGMVFSSGADYISASGGIVSGNTNGEISNCYNTGTITSDSRDCGGIAGFNDRGKFIYCYNIGQSSSGIIGDNRDYIIDCYYLDSVSSNGSGSGLNPEGERLYAFSQDGLCLQDTFAAFDFDTVWVMTDNGPQLQ